MIEPDLTIGSKENPQTRRWHLWLPRWAARRGWQLALHEWCRSDDDRALHDHKSWSVSLVLRGGYYEVTSHAWEPLKAKWYRPGSLIFRRAASPHRVMLDPTQAPNGVLTLWLRGREWRKWGFRCKSGWRPWDEYIAQRDYTIPGSESTVGKGCG